jgi:hypothetical protein
MIRSVNNNFYASFFATAALLLPEFAAAKQAKKLDAIPILFS